MSPVRAMTVHKAPAEDPSLDAFDRRFWSEIPPEQRLALVWEMVLEDIAARDPDAPEPRLQRSVCRVER